MAGAAHNDAQAEPGAAAQREQLALDQERRGAAGRPRCLARAAAGDVRGSPRLPAGRPHGALELPSHSRDPTTTPPHSAPPSIFQPLPRPSQLEKLQAARDARRAELANLEAEVKLEQDAASAVNAICAQANKALTAHTRERDGWRAEADRTAAEARKLKNQLEELAYKVNGLAAGAL